MTTMIASESRPSLPSPSNYTRHADYILARLEIEAAIRQKAEAEWRRTRRLKRTLRIALIVSAALLALTLYLCHA